MAPGYVDHLEAGETADAAHQVDRADDGGVEAVELLERRQARRASFAPEPGRRGGTHGGKHLVGAALQTGEPDGGRAVALSRCHAGQVAADRLVEDVVGRRARHEFAAPPHEQTAIGHAGVELEAVAVERLAERGEAAVRRVVVDVAGRVVTHDAAVHRDEVAAVGDVVGAELHDVDGLERAAAAVDGSRIVAEHRQIADVAAGGHAHGYRPHDAHRAARDEAVHGGRVSRLQRRAPAELVLRLVSHAVGHEQHALGGRGAHVAARPARLSTARLSSPLRARASAAARSSRTWAGTARCRRSAPRRPASCRR